MNRKNHMIITSIFMIIIWIIFNFILGKEYITITQIITAIPLTLFPDIEAGTQYHRHIITHNIIWWIMIYYFNQHAVFLLILIAISLHMLCDIRINKHKWRGFYTIRVLDERLNGKYSTIWLLVNGLFGFIFGIIIMVIY